jgi:predicted ATPase
LIPFPKREHWSAPDLPRPLTSLIGRECDLAALRDLILGDGARLVTISGPGGVGKTRLVVQAASDLRAEFPEGVWFVALAPVRDATLVATTIVRALGVVVRADRPPVETLMAVIRDRRLLLVLDNFEHLLPAAPLVTELLAACPNLVILVTSRARLNLSGESTFTVPSLTLPDSQSHGGGSPISVETAGDAAAVRLFVARAQAVDASREVATPVDLSARHGLTPREIDVLRLLVEGRSKAEIADALFVGVRTTRTHVASILAKLGVANRTEAAALAVRTDLV